jgi:hypothetical protein
MNEIASSAAKALAIVVTGVSGSGKCKVGQEVAKRLCVKFLDADDFHSVANKDKMHRGIALLEEMNLGTILQNEIFPLKVNLGIAGGSSWPVIRASYSLNCLVMEKSSLRSVGMVGARHRNYSNKNLLDLQKVLYRLGQQCHAGKQRSLLRPL